MAEDQKLVKLLQGLIEATARGRMAWEETYDESGFRTVTEHGMIRLGLEYDDDREESILIITLMDRKAKVGDEFRLHQNQAGGPDSTYMFAYNLFKLARRSARAADDLLDRVIADVETLKS